MAYKSKSRKFRDALVTLLSGIQYDAGGGAEPAFGLVTGDPSIAFENQEPFALVYPAPSDDELGAIGQVDRTVAFEIIVLLSLENKQRTQAQTYDYMYDLTELVLDAIEEGDFRDALNQADPTLGVWLMDPARSTFKPGATKSGAILLCTIDIAIKYSKDL